VSESDGEQSRERIKVQKRKKKETKEPNIPPSPPPKKKGERGYLNKHVIYEFCDWFYFDLYYSFGHLSLQIIKPNVQSCKANSSLAKPNVW
jgi:hypothetical protein